MTLGIISVIFGPLRVHMRVVLRTLLLLLSSLVSHGSMVIARDKNHLFLRKSKFWTRKFFNWIEHYLLLPMCVRITVRLFPDSLCPDICSCHKLTRTDQEGCQVKYWRPWTRRHWSRYTYTACTKLLKTTLLDISGAEDFIENLCLPKYVNDSVTHM